jgi:hypothetical protein
MDERFLRTAASAEQGGNRERGSDQSGHAEIQLHSDTFPLLSDERRIDAPPDVLQLPNVVPINMGSRAISL